jgi:hypothetical protein
VEDAGHGGAGGEWARVCGRPCPSRRIADEWLSGLSYNHGAPAQLLVRILDTGYPHCLFRRDLPPGVLDAAVTRSSRVIQDALLDTTAQLSARQWEQLIASEASPGRRVVVQEWADMRLRPWESQAPAGTAPPATAAEIEAMAAEVPDIGPDSRAHALWWVGALHDNPGAMRQLASSPKLWIRRSVARAPRLPPDVADLLARDEDRIVHLFLAESCDDAPPAMLLDVWTWWDGSLSHPGRPRGHPSFPRDGLLRFARDPDPRMRLLALDDPASTAALASQFSRDPDWQVRAAAASDSRLPPGAAMRLILDPHPAVRRQAREHPALPPDVLGPLLHTEHAPWARPPYPETTAKDAAHSPAIPVAVMDRMITLAAECLGDYRPKWR